MSRRVLAAFIAFFGLLVIGPAPAAAPPAKASAPKATVKPAAKPPVRPAPGGAFDARDPASFIALLASMQAKGEVMKSGDGEVFLKVSTPAFAFNAQYVDCDARNHNCGGLAFSAVSDTRTSTLAQLNGFNQTSLTCRVFEDQAGKPHVMYSALLSAADTREEMRTHIGVWQGCLGTFGLFLSDPIGYLASAP